MKNKEEECVLVKTVESMIMSSKLNILTAIHHFDVLLMNLTRKEGRYHISERT